ncbi:MAG: HigA family addiction module antitoxin [Prosthecobacter sp.]|nr:HigA family addiction module antitoxin [Prosthecobacter sp.]
MKTKPQTKAKKTPPDRIPSIHPGEILLHEFLEPAGISQYRLAQATGLPSSRISDLVKGRRGITPDSAIRLGKALGMATEFWLNLQHDYDVREARHAKDEEYAAIPLLMGLTAP